ncbi:ABC transporter permease [Nocardia sp. NPDC003963]
MTATTIDAPIVAKAAVAPRRRPALGRTTQRAISILTPVVILVVWELLARAGVIDERFYPAPTAIFGALWDQATSGALWEQSAVSIGRLLVGIVLGTVPAILIGVAMGLSRVVRAALKPLVSGLYPIPKSAVFPLFLLFFGLGEWTTYWFVAVGAFFPVVINTAAGVANVSSVYYDVSDNFGASRWQVFRSVAIPGAMPSIITGIELGAGMGLIMLSIAEMMGGAGSGWGFMVWNSFQLFAIDAMYAYLLVFAVVGFGVAIIVGAIGRRLTPWITRD